MEDPRCCGTGTCIINAEGLCWCGQRWDGTRMCYPEPAGGPAAGTGQPSVEQGAAQASAQDRYGPTITGAGQGGAKS